MADQTEAQRLADALEQGTYLLSVERNNTAAELRRLHDRDKKWESVTQFMQDAIDKMESDVLRLEAVNAQLLVALTNCISMLRFVGYGDTFAVESGEAAIKAEKGEA